MNKLHDYRIKSPTIAERLYTVKITGNEEKIKENSKIPFNDKVVQIMNKVSDKSHRPDRTDKGNLPKGK